MVGEGRTAGEEPGRIVGLVMLEDQKTDVRFSQPAPPRQPGQHAVPKIGPTVFVGVAAGRRHVLDVGGDQPVRHGTSRMASTSAPPRASQARSACQSERRAAGAFEQMIEAELAVLEGLKFPIVIVEGKTQARAAASRSANPPSSDPPPATLPPIAVFPHRAIPKARPFACRASSRDEQPRYRCPTAADRCRHGRLERSGQDRRRATPCDRASS